MADNTASLVVALSAQLTKFEKDMRDAGIMADKAVNDIENKFSNLNPNMTKASFLGNFFADLARNTIKSAIDAAKEFYDRFLLIDKEAQILGVSMKEVWAFQEVAKAGGAQIEQATKDLQELARLLAEMQRGDKNSLSRLFDAQDTLKGVNRQTLTVMQTWQLVANLIEHMQKGVEKIEVGKLAGLSQDTALALGKAGSNAAALTAALIASAPPLNQLADKAKEFDGYMKSASEWFKGETAQFIHNTIREIQAIRGLFPSITGEPPTRISVGAVQGGTSTFKFTTKLPPQPGAAPPADYDRQTRSIEKQTAAMEAEAATTGETVGATEEYKVQLQLTEAALNQYGVVSAKVNDEIAVTAERAGRAKQAMAENQFALQRLNSASQQLGSALSTAFADAIVDGKSLNEVMKSLITTLEKAAINSLVMSFFTPGAGQTASPIAALFKGFAGGTDYAPGGMALVGEHGPELVNLPRGSQVIPNDVARTGVAGNSTIIWSPAIDARGADVAAVARLAQVVEQSQRSFATNVVATVRKARAGRIL